MLMNIDVTAFYRQRKKKYEKIARETLVFLNVFQTNEF